MKSAMLQFLFLAGQLFLLQTLTAQSVEDAKVSLKVEEAERALQTRLITLFRDGRNAYHSGDLIAAEKHLNECFSLWQLSQEHLSKPKSLAHLIKECEATLVKVRGRQQFEAKVSGWPARLKALMLPQFEIRDADLGSTIQYFQQRVGQAFGETPPNVIFRVGADKIKTRLTLELKNVTAWDALLAIQNRMRVETKFEPHAMILVNAEGIAE